MLVSCTPKLRVKIIKERTWNVKTVQAFVNCFRDDIQVVLTSDDDLVANNGNQGNFIFLASETGRIDNIEYNGIVYENLKSENGFIMLINPSNGHEIIANDKIKKIFKEIWPFVISHTDSLINAIARNWNKLSDESIKFIENEILPLYSQSFAITPEEKLLQLMLGQKSEYTGLFQYLIYLKQDTDIVLDLTKTSSRFVNLLKTLTYHASNIAILCLFFIIELLLDDRIKVNPLINKGKLWVICYDIINHDPNDSLKLPENHPLRQKAQDFLNKLLDNNKVKQKLLERSIL